MLGIGMLHIILVSLRRALALWGWRASPSSSPATISEAFEDRDSLNDPLAFLPQLGKQRQRVHWMRIPQAGNITLAGVGWHRTRPANHTAPTDTVQ
jgi:hypothetical protein